MAANNQLTINITAKDSGVKALFTGIAGDAKTLGSEMSRAGADSSRALDAVGRSAKTAGASLEVSGRSMASVLDSVNKHATLLGTAIGGTAVLALKDFQRAATEVGAAQALLRTAVENTGASFADYKSRISEAEDRGVNLGISVKDTAESLQVLTQETNSTDKALSLLSLTEDLARARHLSMEQATLLMTQALTGNVSALKQHGIILENNATREEIFAALQAKVANQAATYANTTAGQLEVVHAKWEQLSAAVGDHLGVVNQVVGLLPGLSVGYEAAASAGGLVVDMLRAQKVAASEAAIAMEAESVAGETAALAEGGLLAAMTGPAGLIVGGLALAAGIGYLITRHHDQAAAVEHVTSAVEQLNSAYGQLAGAGIDGGVLDKLFGVKTESGQLQPQFEAATQQVADLQSQLDALGEASGRVVQGGANIDYKTGQTGDQINAQMDLVKQQIAAAKALQGSQADLDKAAAAEGDIYAHIHDSGVDTVRVANELTAAFDKYEATVAAGHPDFVTFEADVQAVKDGMYAQTKAATDATDEWTKLSELMQSTWTGVMDPLKNVDDQIKHIFTSQSPDAAAWQVAAKGVLATFKDLIDHTDDPAKITAAYAALGAGLAQVDLGLTIADNTRTAASNAAIGAYHDQAAAQQSMSDQIVANNYRIHASELALDAYRAQRANDLALAGTQGQNRAMFGPDSVGAQGAAAAAGVVATHAATIADAYNQMNTASLDSSAQGSAYFATQAAGAAEADAAIRKYIADLGMMPTAADQLAAVIKPPTPAKVDTGFLKDLINVQGVYGQIDDALAAGAITQDQYNLAQKTYNALTVEGAGDTKELVTQFINAKGQYGVIDDLLAQGAITQKQYNDLQKIGTEVLKERSQVDFSVIAGLQHSTTTLSDMTRVVIGNTDSIKGSSDSLKKWADDLIGPVGAISEIDTLQQKGKLTQEEYNAAQWAQVSIGETNARVQEDVAVIQAKQAPLLATLADQQEAYLNQISELPAAQQLAALGFMDTAESAKAMQLNAMAAAAAMGQLGDQGEASTTKIIQGAAEADPALAAMLESMGLISMGADGTITVNFPTGESVQSAIDGLQTSVNNLVAAEYLIYIGADMSDYWDHINGLDGQHVGSVYVDVIAAYSAPLLPYENPMYGRRNGGIVGYDGGGVVARMAEAGPELLDYPGGGHGLAVSDGYYNVPRGTYVHTAPATKAMGPGGGNRYFQHYGNVYNYPSSGATTMERARADILGERR